MMLPAAPSLPELEIDEETDFRGSDDALLIQVKTRDFILH
jgi:hypothetical protein